MSFPQVEGAGAGQWRFRHEHEQAGPVRFIAPPTEQEIDEPARANDQVDLRDWQSDPVPER